MYSLCSNGVAKSCVLLAIMMANVTVQATDTVYQWRYRKPHHTYIRYSDWMSAEEMRAAFDAKTIHRQTKIDERWDYKFVMINDRALEDIYELYRYFWVKMFDTSQQRDYYENLLNNKGSFNNTWYDPRPVNEGDWIEVTEDRVAEGALKKIAKELSQGFRYAKGWRGVVTKVNLDKKKWHVKWHTKPTGNSRTSVKLMKWGTIEKRKDFKLIDSPYKVSENNVAEEGRKIVAIKGTWKAWRYSKGWLGTLGEFDQDKGKWNVTWQKKPNGELITNRYRVSGNISECNFQLLDNFD